MIGTMIGTLAGSAAGTMAAYAVSRAWYSRKDRLEEHASWNASIMADITGGVKLTEDDRFILDVIDATNPDLDVLDYDVPVDDDGEDV